MTKRYIIILFSVSLITSIILPFIFRANESVNEIFTVISTLISSFASLFTFAFALILYNKFGIEQTILENNTSTVFKLVEKLKETRFFASGDKFMLQIKMSDPHLYHFEKYYKNELIFSIEYYNGIEEILNISNNPYLPKSIAEKLNKLHFYSLSMDVKDKEIEKYTKISVVGHPDNEGKWGRFNGKNMNLFEFLNILQDVSIETKKWLKNNSSINIDLNL